MARRAAAGLLLAALLAGVAASAVKAVDLVRPDCPSFSTLAADFVRARTAAERGDDVDLRGRGEALVRCGRLVGRTPGELTAALGPPLRDERSRRGRPHRELSYALGVDTGSVSLTDISLFMQAERGRVVYAVVDGEQFKVADGEPVG